MRTMEFLTKNLLNTTTMVTVASGTGTVEYLFDRNISVSYTSESNTGNTSSVMTVTFDNPTVLSRIMLQNHNLKQFRIFRDGATASTFTPDINVSQNSETSSLFVVNSTTVSSISLQMDDVINSQERQIGEFYVGDCSVALEYNPDATNYDPKLYRQKIKHTMPDGGTNLYIVANKFQANLSLKFISETIKTGLRNIFNDSDAFYFVPEGTTSGWAGEAHEVVWANDWDFTYAENSKTQGHEGKITLEETPNT